MSLPDPGAELPPPVPDEGAQGTEGIDPELQAWYEAQAENYDLTRQGLIGYAQRNSENMVQLSDTSWILAAGLPPKEEYGAKPSDIGLGLTLEIDHDPRVRRNTYTLTLYHDRAPGKRSGRAESTIYHDPIPGEDFTDELDVFDNDIAMEWFAGLFAAETQGTFSPLEAFRRLPPNHSSALLRRARSSYASAQVAVKTWLAAQNIQGEEAA